jgi:cell wall-associated NlpC family hydrolase
LAFGGNTLLGSEPAAEEGGAGYELKFTLPVAELTHDLTHGERGQAEREADIAHKQWYSREIRRRLGSWGPRARTYTALEGWNDRSIEWRRERVIATAARLLGYGYQHHHIPNWDPPKGWPWQETCMGKNGKGLDCSNFTAFVYNQGFGLRMTGAVTQQAYSESVLLGGKHRVAVRRIDLPSTYAERRNTLHTGDLLYIRGRDQGPITHVVIWVGSVGHSPSGLPLIMDSHGADVKDEEGRKIVGGIQLRPYRENSWYNRCASHALRLV